MQIQFGRFNKFYLRSLLITLHTILLTCLFSTQSYSQGCQSPGFDPAVDFNVNLYPKSVTVGDFNGDGNPDLAAANSFTDSVSLLLGDGRGNFGTARNFKVGGYPTSIAEGDLNGDGYPDLVTVSSSRSNGSVLFGDGKGNFINNINFSVGRYPMSISTGDFNGDNKPDLVVANYSISKVSVLLKNSSGSFNTAKNYDVADHSTAVTIGDFNKDGNADIAVTNYFINKISVLLGDGTGNFGAANYFVVGNKPTSITTADFNNDGNTDIATANYGSNNVSILLGDGNGSFSSPINFGAGAHPWSIATGDINHDSYSDLAVTSYSSNYVSVILGDGTGKFGTPSYFNTGATPWSVAIGDLNNDGSLDLTVANYGSNNLSVLLNACSLVQINQAPVVSCKDITVSADVNCQAEVSAEQVDDGSSDPDGDALTFSLSPTGPYPVGENEVTLTVSDGQDESTCTATITVIDDSEPVLVAITDPIELWPPNHKYENINVNQLLVSVTSNCNTITNDDVSIVSVGSDEVDNAKNYGDGNTINDIVISPDCKSVYLRKERQGSGNGRVYTIMLGAIDGSGNTATTTCFVTVPLSKDGNGAIDDRPINSVSSTCGGIFVKNNLNTKKYKNEPYQLEQNFPNPFNPSTKISYVVLQPGYVKLSVYNVLGEEVAILVDHFVEAGTYEVSFDASNLSSGLYLYKLQYDNQFQIRKMLLSK
jgi:hypothetical protein